ncbi:MFS transporter [Hydrogenophaga sp. D2P1]|uniref:MFS transporter n=1 Tax=Hydrogenophaga aromaticivorans TaxID=2610898 RepID=A0A7Y8L0A3_9BURK|nr:MFS transporter [Hydrogenophaga aromaticivorans]NWF48477.1 MFS transporter [Hydrogenophaga aromaticivorans]
MAHLLLLAIVYVSFVSLGLPDAVMGVIWPAMRADMGQPLAALGVLTLTMTVCAALSAGFAGRIVARVGTGVVVAASCLMTALALVGFSVAPSFAWLVLLGIPLGAGGGAVDASLNHFVAAHYSSRHMNWLHGFWGVGATTGPAVMGLALASPGGWTRGILALGLAQLTLAALLWATLSLWRRERSQPADAAATREPPVVFKPVARRALWLAPLCFLFYVAAEMGTGLWAASILVNDRGISLAQAGFWVSLYFGAITAGRFGVGLVSERLGNRRLVRLGATLALAGAALFALPGLPALVSLAGLVLMGLGCAPVFPSLMHEAARRFPADVARTVIGRQMMAAYAGGSVIPAAFGLLATWVGLGAVMPVVMLLLIALLWATRALDRLT